MEKMTKFAAFMFVRAAIFCLPEHISGRLPSRAGGLIPAT